MKVQVGKGLDDACIEIVPLINGRKSGSISFLYGVATV